MDTQMPPTQGHIYGDDPHRSVAVTGRHEEEEMHYDKKPVLTKVKEKVKKIRETLTHKRHDHGDDYDQEDGGYGDDDEEDMEENPELHGAPPRNLAFGQHENPGQMRVDSGKIFGNFEEDPGAPKQKSEVFIGSDQTQICYPSSIGSEEGNSGQERVDLGKISGTVDEDPTTPKNKSDALTRGDQTGFHYPSSKGEEYGGVKPVSDSFQAMTMSDQLEGEKGEEHHDQFSPDKPQTEPGPQEEPEKEPKSYTEKATSAAKDAAVGSTEYGKIMASTVYKKVGEAGTVVMEKMKKGGTTETEKGGGDHKGASVRELLAEKLKPDEEDRALFEVISEVIRKREEEEEERREVTGSGEGVVGKIRGAVASLFGGGVGSRAPPVSDNHPKESALEKPEN